MKSEFTVTYFEEHGLNARVIIKYPQKGIFSLHRFRPGSSLSEVEAEIKEYLHNQVDSIKVKRGKLSRED